MEPVFYLAIAAVIVCTWFITRFYFLQKLQSRGMQLQELKAGLQELKTEKQSIQQEKEILIQQKARLEADFGNLSFKLQNQKQEMEQLGDKFKHEFNTLAQHILEEKTEKFTRVNEEKMKAILDPLKTQLGEFKTKVEETYDKESKERFSLGREIQALVQMSQQVSQEANNLSTALKGNVKMQGNWGEMILESILENCGLTKNREYFIQEFIRDAAGNTIKDENGHALQPDVTVYYPDQRKVIVDAKVSLVAWEQYVSASDAQVQQDYLSAHIRSIRQHIENLSRKNYPKYAAALDYVLLFIPIEPAFLEALKSDTGLWKTAYDKKILLVSPTNLLVVLKIIADLWKVEKQNRNAIEIADKAGALYDKFVLFTESLEEVGSKIEDAQKSYEKAFKQLVTGRGNITGKVEELKKMGASAGKQLPDSLLIQGPQ